MSAGPSILTAQGFQGVVESSLEELDPELDPEVRRVLQFWFKGEIGVLLKEKWFCEEDRYSNSAANSAANSGYSTLPQYCKTTVIASNTTVVVVLINCFLFLHCVVEEDQLML